MDLGYYVQFIITLGVLSVILYLTMRFAKRMQAVRYSGEIKIVDRLGIGQNATLYIVDVRGTQYLFTLSGKDIHLVKEL